MSSHELNDWRDRVASALDPSFDSLDGVRVSVTGMPAQEEANRIAELFVQPSLRTIVINMEHAAFDRGLAQKLAVAPGGAFYNLPELRADTLLSTVKREIDS